MQDTDHTDRLWRTVARGLSTLLSCVLAGGCAFIGLQEDVALFQAATAISGTVKSQYSSGKPIFVALYRQEAENQYALKAYSAQYGPGEFRFLRGQGDYYLFAFEDANEDFTFQKSERVGWYGAPTLIKARPGADFTDLEIAIRDPEAARRELPEIYASKVPPAKMAVAGERLGEIVDIIESDFSPEFGALGLWEPVKFVQRSYNGVFFLEPYNPAKTPVLFIHGIGASAQVWQNVISKMDRDRFQPWVVQYPSGLPLTLIGEGLDQAITKLHIKHKFEDLIVVAHSIGGLVAHDFINKNAARHNSSIVRVFVTLSTPWQGHPAAQLGVDNAPVVVPSWYDIVPGSPYIESILSQPLPDSVSYYLIFSHRGSYSLLGEGNADGAVTLRSQLTPMIQENATKIVGFYEDHASILNSERVAQKLNEIMALAGKTNAR